MAQQVTEADAKAAATAASEAFAKAYNNEKQPASPNCFARWNLPDTCGDCVAESHGHRKAIAARRTAGWTKETIDVIEAHSTGENVWALVSYNIDGSAKENGRSIGGYAVQVLKRDADRQSQTGSGFDRHGGDQTKVTSKTLTRPQLVGDRNTPAGSSTWYAIVSGS
jgi:hypothetical protein